MQRLSETLPDQASSELADVASRISLGLQRAGADIVAIGGDLLTAKEMLGHGRFGIWLEQEFGLSQRTAERFMSAARRFGRRPDSVSDFPPGVIHELSAPGTPDDIVDSVIAGQIPATVKAVRSATQARRLDRTHTRAVRGLIDELWDLPNEIYDAAEAIATEVLKQDEDFAIWATQTLSGAAELIAEGREVGET